MPRCCVCGKEAEHLYHGLRWCEKHYPAPERKGEEKSKESVIRGTVKS